MLNSATSLPLHLKISYPYQSVEEKSAESASKSDLGLSAFSDDFLPFSHDYFNDASSNLHQQTRSSEKFEKEQSESKEHSTNKSNSNKSSSSSLNSTSTSLICPIHLSNEHDESFSNSSNQDLCDLFLLNS
jgi:hypothetical protein